METRALKVEGKLDRNNGSGSAECGEVPSFKVLFPWRSFKQFVIRVEHHRTSQSHPRVLFTFSFLSAFSGAHCDELQGDGLLAFSLLAVLGLFCSFIGVLSCNACLIFLSFLFLVCYLCSK